MTDRPRLVAALLALALPAIALPAFAADLEVSVREARGGGGPIKLMLFDREDGFRKEDRARQVLTLAPTGAPVGVFRDLPPGRYAVVVYHDENGDGKLNLRFGMFPKEGYGLSNAPRLAGPPRFRDAAFDLPERGARIDIRLDY